MIDHKEIRTTKKYSNLLASNWIQSIKGLLEYFPRTYEDRSQIKTLQDVTTDNTVQTVKWYVTEKKFHKRWGRKVYEVIFHDIQEAVGYIRIFGSAFQAQQIQKNKRYLIIGKPQLQYWKIVFTHPDTALSEEGDEEWYKAGRIYPIYPELQWIKPGRFAQKIRTQIDNTPNLFPELYPEEFLKRYTLMNLPETIKNMHFPSDFDILNKAKYRIFFDRICRMQILSQLQKNEYNQWKQDKEKNKPNRNIIKEIIDTLPFTLTNAQKKVIKQTIEEIHEPNPMLKLLQWDVWSWKTIVATIIAYYIIKHQKQQCAFIAPLAILAQQHAKTIAKTLLPLWIHLEVITWSLTASQKVTIKNKLKDWRIDCIIGTHALLQEWIRFNDLWLVIIDEQHKFWVRQRAFFKQFNSPHIIQMSATPIPRSMALAFFGEFSVSNIDEMPAGRKPIYTKIVSDADRIKLKPRMMEKINEWQKVFIVAPLIEESDKLENVQAATTVYQEVKELFSEMWNNIGLIHGRMKEKEKKSIMEKFKEWTVSILVATTVIEVWVDIPEATIMVIKNADRFGLSQLHQLRGRIGRSDLSSYCFLQTHKKSWETYKRLKAMEKTNDGFELAEIDLEYRWPWEMLWTQQSWISDIPLDILTDTQFIQKAQDAAKWLLEQYDITKLPALKQQLDSSWSNILA